MNGYPSRFAETWLLAGGLEVLVRGVRPRDADALQAFIRGLSQASRYTRFFRGLRELPPDLLASFVHIDPRREIALVVTLSAGGQERIIADARCVADSEGRSAEFAVVVADEFQCQGLGGRLVKALGRLAAAGGVGGLKGEILSTNEPMLRLARGLGFQLRSDPADASITLAAKPLAVQPAAEGGMPRIRAAAAACATRPETPPLSA